jgi:hypothetical protein
MAVWAKYMNSGEFGDGHDGAAFDAVTSYPKS